MDGVMTLGPTAAAEIGGDRDLVLRALDGQGAARDALADRYRGPAYLFALHLLGDRDDALDVAQEAMLRLFTHLGRLDPARPVKPWLFAVVRNRARDLWRRRKVRRAEPLDAAPGDLTRELADDSADPERDARRSELRRELWRTLSRLDPPKREILVLRDYHDLTYAEIAEVLGIPLGTVMSRLHAARRALREALPERVVAAARDGR